MDIDEAKWEAEVGSDSLKLTVSDKNGHPVTAYMQTRPAHCDRGHLMVLIEGIPDIDRADSFPRYFFSAKEADWHVRTFLKWRLWRVPNADRPPQRSLQDIVSKMI